MTERQPISSPIPAEAAPESAPFVHSNVVAHSGDGSSSSDHIDLEDSTTSSHHNSQRHSNSSSHRCAVVEATRAETTAVKRSKLLVYIALALAAVAVGTVTYVLSTKQETENYKNEFSNSAREISRLTEENVKSTIGQVHSLSVMVTSIAMSNNATWPYVSVPHFARRAREAEELTGIELLLFAPIVPHDEREDWERYAWEHQVWIDQDLKVSGHQETDVGKISKRIYTDTENATSNDGPHVYKDGYVPIWQLGPVPRNASVINLDLNRHPSFRSTIYHGMASRHAMLSGMVDLNFLLENSLLQHDLDLQPRSYILEPVFSDFEDTVDSEVTGFFVADLQWGSFFVDLLPTTANGVLVVVHDTCGDTFSYMVDGPNATFLNSSYVPDAKFAALEERHEFAAFMREDADNHSCQYYLSISPTDDFVRRYQTNEPAIYTTVVVLIFCLTGLVFALYDYFVHVRQEKLHATAKRTNEIVASMFPKEFQKRVMDDAKDKATTTLNKYAPTEVPGLGGLGHEIFKTKPIADLFNEVTVMFADIVGFTAWSSVREPCEVFTLLETIFHEYDVIASQRKVFKVETVGDCYVAVAGLPDPRKDHAVVMARFARDCLLRFNSAVQHLENSLGPDTSDLGMRFGLHSGPVTAGVLRGERSRFQLFGDTMNTAARIESTGMKNKIHLSESTAERLSIQGKGHWCVRRQDKVVAKGKGELKTFWLELRGDTAKSSQSGSSDESDKEACPGQIPNQFLHREGAEARPDFHNSITTSSLPPTIAKKHDRLVNWNTDILLRMLKEIVARRHEAGTRANFSAVRRLEADHLHGVIMVRDEIVDVIPLRNFDVTACQTQIDPAGVELNEAVSEQLREYVTTIANLHRDNAFHNFEHASHVTMSTVKLLSRMVAPKSQGGPTDHTLGIASDPLTQFALLFSALVHDVDHAGVPNAQLVREQAGLASVYKNQSVAEQNSVDIAWDLLMHEQFRELRRVIYVNEEEFRHFRQLLVNAVMATDIMDKDANVGRRERWKNAFGDTAHTEDEARRDTLVIEHLIQASDIAHTMQHWHIYRKWNARLFKEMYKAHRDGRAENDPSLSWYEGELTFFDFFVVPLATKLKECGAFGAAGDEYLQYAQQNRREWESKGRHIVAEMKAESLSAV